jgi:hypothetical protein
MNLEQQLWLRRREVLHVTVAKNLGIVLMTVKWFCATVVSGPAMQLLNVLF